MTRRAALLLLPAVIALAGCSASTGSGSSEDTVTVVYQLSGTAKTVDATWTDGGTSTSQQTDARVPWSKTLQVRRQAVTVLQVSGQNKGTSGDVTCTIRADGKIMKTITSRGGYVIASCDYTLQ